MNRFFHVIFTHILVMFVLQTLTKISKYTGLVDYKAVFICAVSLYDMTCDINHLSNDITYIYNSLAYDISRMYCPSKYLI